MCMAILYPDEKIKKLPEKMTVYKVVYRDCESSIYRHFINLKQMGRKIELNI